jgi:putative toxin-antitoxin system antitoxin component (TIGR02293 family)
LDPKIRDVIDLLKNRMLEERDTVADEEKVVRLLDILTLAHRVFGDEEKAKAWLKRPNATLSGQKPRDLLMDELGAAVVRETLEQIDNGIFA